MEDINLHFTGDFHAIGAANNLLAAMLDNHIYQGNALNIDPRKITWRRCVDMNDRQLRFVVDGLGGKTNGCPREDGYDITVASEIMAVLCLASDITDLKKRLARIIVGYTYGKASEQKPVTAGDLHAEGAMAALLKDALKPNLVQTLEGVPAIVHGGPFANIAHGCNSVTATKMSLKLADYTITEAGFGADLGAEKFLDIKCRMAGLKPNAVVIVATVRALKYNGGVPKAELNNENLEALEKGMPNLLKHVSNIKNVYKLPCVVAINAFPTDTKACLLYTSYGLTESAIDNAIAQYGEDKAVSFPDTAYSLPCYYSVTGVKVSNLKELKEALGVVKTLMTREKRLNDAFMSGVATALCAEFIEVLKYIDGAAPYEEPCYGHLADAVIRELGVPLVTGDIPGVAVILGSAPSVEEGVALVKSYQAQGILVTLEMCIRDRILVVIKSSSRGTGEALMARPTPSSFL